MISQTARLRLVTDAASEPVTLADAKAYARVDLGDDDILITALIAAARRRVEKETGLALLTQSWVSVFDRWPDSTSGGGLSSPWWDGVREAPLSMVSPSGVIEIPKRPFQAVTQMKLRDAYGSFVTVDPSIYYTEVSDMRGRIVRVLGKIWPVIVMAPRSAIEISFTAGFDAAPYSGVPDDLLLAIKMLVKHWYDNREPVAEGKVGKLPAHIDAILGSYRAVRLQ
ncbi:head-tail connector protein [Methylosinus sp. LW4]|uniref:head-tail connector protein n=1 Tax=Methylosinus sp. LW4 TaxID=136993 RepID=UPI000361DF0D|nr:head-tail connector protein [Methylosinus sp. LW4]